MKKTAAALALALGLAASPALAGAKPCAELQAEIAAKIEAKGVRNARLEIVTAEDVQGRKVVGSCELGTRKIVYVKG